MPLAPSTASDAVSLNAKQLSARPAAERTSVIGSSAEPMPCRSAGSSSCPDPGLCGWRASSVRSSGSAERMSVVQPPATPPPRVGRTALVGATSSAVGMSTTVSFTARSSDVRSASTLRADCALADTTNALQTHATRPSTITFPRVIDTSFLFRANFRRAMPRWNEWNPSR